MNRDRSIVMEQLFRTFKPMANIYIISISWVFTIFNCYLFARPLIKYSRAVDMTVFPVVLDSMNYYTPAEGYRALTSLGDDGREAYRLANYADFLLPFFLALSLSLSNLALGRGSQYLIAPLIYMIADYSENIAEKYVLEIYPKRNDLVMTVACYAGLIRMASLYISVVILIINVFRWLLTSKKPKKPKLKLK